jgi:hypothetical protein
MNTSIRRLLNDTVEMYLLRSVDLTYKLILTLPRWPLELQSLCIDDMNYYLIPVYLKTLLTG